MSVNEKKNGKTQPTQILKSERPKMNLNTTGLDRHSQETPFIYDIYILRTSGVPLLAGCTGSDYCKAHLEQHVLHCGFFSAMYAFSKEAFTSSELRSIFYDDIQLNFKIDPKHELIVVLVHSSEYSAQSTQKQVEVVWSRFVEKYHTQIHSTGPIANSLFDSFRADLQELGVTPSSQLFPTLTYTEQALSSS